MGKPRSNTEQLNGRFTCEMSTKGDSVLLTIRLKPEKREIDTVNKVTGSKDILRMTLGCATIGQTDGWRERKHPFCNECTFLRPKKCNDHRGGAQEEEGTTDTRGE